MSYSDKPISQKVYSKISIPYFLTESQNKKITIPYFLTQGNAKQVIPNTECQPAIYQNEYGISTMEVVPYGCWTNCEVTTQQCKECTTCQGCEDNCQHGSCESACMSYCEVNGECGNCLNVCQTNCQTSCMTYCEMCETTCELNCQSSCESSCQSGQGCTHPNTYWTSWTVIPDLVTHCKRDLICRTCGQVIQTEKKEHTFQGTGKYSFYDASYHREVGACSRCGYGLYRLESHSFTNGVCSKCGAVQGGDGGGSLPPSITSFEAIPSSNGMSIDCSVVATGAKNYIYNLYDDTSNHNLISTSNMTTSTGWTFSTIPNTTYLVAVEAYNPQGVKTSSSTTVKTPAQKPAQFIWKETPQTNKDFNVCITSSEWERLQVTINAWRVYYNQTPYAFIQIPSADNSFTVARTGEDFTYIYYNQIISGISTIPQFKGTLPSKKTQNPKIWLASDFIMFQTAVNSFLV